MRRYDLLFLVLCGTFIASLIICNALAFKLIDLHLPLFGTVTLPLGILPYPVTFLMTDLICELYGKKQANSLVWIGFGLSAYFLFFLILGRYLPVSHVQDPIIQTYYMGVFGQSARAIFASMVAYLIAQFLDVRLFHFIKEKTKGRHLWLRNNGSTLFSQLIDTICVMSILFWEQPNLIGLIITGYVFKLLAALADTPLFYLGAIFFKDIQAESLRRATEHSAEA